MAKNNYECLFILDSNRYARDPGAIGGQIAEMIEKSDGRVLASRLWVEQKLAYPINGQRKGTYWLAYFEMASEKVSEFNRSCRLNDNVLRNLTLRVDNRLVETFVRHVGGVTDEAPTEPEPQPETPAEAEEVATDDNPADSAATTSA